MAYYDNAPSHKPQGKKSFGREKWVEEGSEYRGARHGGRPSGKRDDNRAYTHLVLPQETTIYSTMYCPAPAL